MSHLSIGGSNGASHSEAPTPNLDDIPDMEEEDLEEAEDDAAAAPTPAPVVKSVPYRGRCLAFS